ncbi:MAG TPA: tRNA(Ile)(2)-agmatinylcytidine synthase [Candidatus Bathyarchaeia archaeon]|nr:tRNA(Ile)(2)-agmatinylcytidine synthase [Candidatus Bathyarchaeia archaeon]
MLTEFHIGFDDTDSPAGGCTTFTAALVFEQLVRLGCSPIDFPWIVRLNPNIPWKTRGNAALAIRLRVEEDQIDTAKNATLRIVESTSDPSVPSTDPAVAFLTGLRPSILRDFSRRALYDVLTVEEARRVVKTVGIDAHVFGKARGLIGALAALGSEFEDLHTFEIIAYRTAKYLGSTRRVAASSVREMNLKHGDTTFNNIDDETGRILITPRGPDPVLLGIRGDDPVKLISAFECVQVAEPIERVALFKTNQGTDAHLTFQTSVQKLRPYVSAVLLGRVQETPRIIRGGHVFFELTDDTGIVDCAAYEPSGRFRSIVRKLVPGDKVRVSGGVRQGPGGRLTLNLERLEILQLADDLRFFNPVCAGCNARCESMGRNQGFRCRKCGRKYPDSSRVPVLQYRTLVPGMYLPPVRARRHLTRPIPEMTSLVLQDTIGEVTTIALS